MITKQQILGEMLKHLISSYDYGNINNGGICGGEEAADAILNLIQIEPNGELLHTEQRIRAIELCAEEKMRMQLITNCKCAD